MVALKRSMGKRFGRLMGRSRNAVVALKLDPDQKIPDIIIQEAGTPWWH